ncbi:sec-independent protein translocase protein TatB [Nicoletella semolina]|uniref:Sec-independent protein translocase protein TatB n=1 Tax=Nicoletella semolina TaxID=271160 RepID=A0A4R2N8U5_9PAST|nr:Sec-independent protein translocase protein TatB [Nicoletella semolina]MDH2924481.1 sec-independent translocase [Nicoletella semolina]TCP17393.1 sec-independent protein translocase protein TatB [Nicoletella semolina]
MFDISFSELLLVFIIGLIVLGPKRLPVAIRTVMGWISTIRGLAANVQNELTQELKLQELQESIKKAESLNLAKLSPELSKAVEELKQSAQKAQEGVNGTANEIQRLSDEEIKNIQQRLEKGENAEVLKPQQTLQNTEQNIPLVEQKEISPDESAELAEENEEMSSIHCPPDDELANTTHQQDKQNVS